MATIIPIRAIYYGSIGGTYLARMDRKHLVIDDRGYVIGVRKHMWPLAAPVAQEAFKAPALEGKDLFGALRPILDLTAIPSGAMLR